MNPVARADLEAHERAIASLYWHWKDFYEKEAPNDPILHTKIMVAALTHLASRAAVDCGLDEDQFIDVCRSNYVGASKHAPKWS